MKLTTNLANRLEETLLNGKWIANTNYKEILSDVSITQATYKIANLNTIALLTFHINYYLKGVLEVFEGGKLTISDKYSFDAPELNSEEDWQALIQELITNSEKIVRSISKMEIEQLESVFEKEIYGTYQRNIEALIEHSYYHLGQISLIKKMVFEEKI